MAEIDVFTQQNLAETGALQSLENLARASAQSGGAMVPVWIALPGVVGAIYGRLLIVDGLPDAIGVIDMATGRLCAITPPKTTRVAAARDWSAYLDGLRTPDEIKAFNARHIRKIDIADDCLA